MSAPGFGAQALRLYTLAAQHLGWRPPDFWSATPTELLAALIPPDGSAPGMDRSTLKSMMEQDNGSIAR